MMSMNDESVLGKRKRQAGLPVIDRSQARIDHYFSGSAKPVSCSKKGRSAISTVSRDIQVTCGVASTQPDSLSASLPNALQLLGDSGLQGGPGSQCIGIDAVHSAHYSTSRARDTDIAAPTTKAHKSGRKPTRAGPESAPMPEHHTAGMLGAHQHLPDQLAVFVSALAERQQFRE